MPVEGGPPGTWAALVARGAGENINVSGCDFSTGDDSMAGGYWHNMLIDQWPYFPSYGAYFRNVDEVILDNVSFSTIGPDDRESIFTDNVGYLKR